MNPSYCPEGKVYYIQTKSKFIKHACNYKLYYTKQDGKGVKTKIKREVRLFKLASTKNNPCRTIVQTVVVSSTQCFYY